MTEDSAGRVIIVGAGPVGLGAALELARCGVRSVLIEKHDTTSWHPKTRNFNTRTMEIARGWGPPSTSGSAALTPRRGGRARSGSCGRRPASNSASSSRRASKDLGRTSAPRGRSCRPRSSLSWDRSSCKRCSWTPSWSILLRSILVVEPVPHAERSCFSRVPFSATPVSLYTGVHGLDGSPLTR